MILGVVFYIVSNCVFYTSLSDLLNKRPQMLYTLIMARINVSALDYWTEEVCTRTGGLGLQFFYPNFIPVSIDYSKPKLSN